MSETDYTRITYDLTMAVAGTLARTSPQMTFVFTSGASADSSEQGTVMWARVKGKAENGVLGLPFKASYVFRPGAIQPLHGITSRTGWYRALYVVLGPAMSLARWLAPRHILTTRADRPRDDPRRAARRAEARPRSARHLRRRL